MNERFTLGAAQRTWAGYGGRVWDEDEMVTTAVDVLAALTEIQLFPTGVVHDWWSLHPHKL